MRDHSPSRNAYLAVATFIVGLGGGLGGPRLSAWIFPAAGAVDRVSGVDAKGMVEDASVSMAAAPESSPIAAKPHHGKGEAPTGALDPLPHFPAQEVARRALKYAVSVRGDGVYGSGIVVDTRGYILTNHHVIQGLETIRVSLVDGDEMQAKVVDDDKELDLAMLKVDATLPVAATPSDFLDAQVGDDVYAVGCPRKMNFSVARGMVSFVGRKVDGHYYVQASLPTNDGNSGGPVVNDRGEVIGVMTFILRDSQGLAFAVPLDYAFERFAGVLQNDHMDVARFKKWREDRDSATASR